MDINFGITIKYIINNIDFVGNRCCLDNPFFLLFYLLVFLNILNMTGNFSIFWLPKVSAIIRIYLYVLDWIIVVYINFNLSSTFSHPIMLKYTVYNLSVQLSHLGSNRALLKMCDNIVLYIDVRGYYPSCISIYNSGPIIIAIIIAEVLHVSRVYLCVV